MKKQIYTVIIFSLFLSKLLIAQDNPTAGQLVITEIMANPAAVSDSNGEWFEIKNISNQRLSLLGLTIADLGSNEHTITSDETIVIEPGEYFVLARNSQPDVNGGLVPNYVYNDFALGNSEDEIIIKLQDGTLIDAVSYTSDWKLSSGASLELPEEFQTAELNDLFGNWKPAVQPFGLGDLGTPGQPNSKSSAIHQAPVLNRLEIFPNPTSGDFYVSIDLNTPANISLRLVNLLGQCIPVYEGFALNATSIPVKIDQIEQGLYWLELVLGNNLYYRKIILLKD